MISLYKAVNSDYCCSNRHAFIDDYFDNEFCIIDYNIVYTRIYHAICRSIDK